jgi:hypothetical protein
MIDADRKRDAERNMSYAALAGMLAFPLLIIMSSYMGLDKAASLLSDIAGISYIAVSAVLGSYFGFNTLSEIKTKKV